MVDLSDSSSACALVLPPRENINDSDTLIRQRTWLTSGQLGTHPQKGRGTRVSSGMRTAANLALAQLLRIPVDSRRLRVFVR